MELGKALKTIKSVCDYAIADGKLASIDDALALADAYNTLVALANLAVANQQNSNQPAPTQDTTPAADSNPSSDANLTADSNTDTTVSQATEATSTPDSTPVTDSNPAADALESNTNQVSDAAPAEAAPAEAAPAEESNPSSEATTDSGSNTSESETPAADVATSSNMQASTNPVFEDNNWKKED